MGGTLTAPAPASTQTGRELSKDDQGVQVLHRELLRQFDGGRQTAVDWEEIDELLRSATLA